METAVRRLLCMLVLANLLESADAATLISFPGSEAAPGLPGYRTYTLTATSDAGKIIGFNFDGSGGSGLGVVAYLAQSNPFGASTVFNDTPEAQFTAAGSHIKADTHFLVKGADGIFINAKETATYIGAAWNISNAGNAGSSMPFLQLVLPSDAGLEFWGFFTIQTPAGNNVLEMVSGWMPGNVPPNPDIPEPTSVLILIIGLGCLVQTARIQYALKGI